MKKNLFLGIFMLLVIASNAQDIIIKKNGEEIKTKVLEVAVAEIKYKKYDFQDGPTYSISKSEVLLIKYENGTNEVITATPVTPAPTTTTTPTTPAPAPEPEKKVSQRIDNSSGSYYQGGRYISKSRVQSTLKSVNDPEINKLLKKSKTNKTIGSIIAVPLGIPLMVVGTVTLLRGVAMSASNDNFTGAVDPDAKGVTTVGGVLAGVGVVFQFTNIIFHAKANSKFDQAIDVYNQKYADKATDSK